VTPPKLERVPAADRFTGTNPVHVLIDCTAIPANRGGVGRYIEGLLGGFGDEVRLTIAVQERDRDLGRLAPAADLRVVRGIQRFRPLRLLWEQIGLPLLARRVAADVVHSPHYTFPVIGGRRRVVTLHDATFFSDPGVHSALKRGFFRFWTSAAWKRADAVVLPSAATLSEIERFLGPARARTVVALHGVDTAVFHPPTEAELAELQSTVGIDADRGWIAYLGTIEPRKNIGALLDAYGALRAELKDTAPELLIAGGRGWDAGVLSRLDAGEPGVRALGYLPLELLPALLGGAQVVAYPSLAEGFGLPVLEAMASGAVVLTTRRLALPEVGGDAVEYSEPDAEAILAALIRLLSDDGRRAQLREAALDRAALLDWSASAHAHLTAYTTTGDSA